MGTKADKICATKYGESVQVKKNKLQVTKITIYNDI